MQLTPWSWTILERPPGVQLLKNFPAFYRTQSFITVFARALHWSIQWARPIQSIPPHSMSIRFALILSTHLRLGLLVVTFHLAFPLITHIRSSSPKCNMACPSHHPWLDHSSCTWRRVQVMKLLIMLLSPTSYHFTSLGSKYSPQHPVLKHPHSVFFR
jgi:hypothetical protein